MGAATARYRTQRTLLGPPDCGRAETTQLRVRHDRADARCALEPPRTNWLQESRRSLDGGGGVGVQCAREAYLQGRFDLGGSK